MKDNAQKMRGAHSLNEITQRFILIKKVKQNIHSQK